MVYALKPSRLRCLVNLSEKPYTVYTSLGDVSLTNSTRLGKSLWSLSGMPYTPSS